MNEYFQQILKTPVVAVLGPYSDSQHGRILTIAANIRRARDIAAELLSLGFSVYCPHCDWELAVRRDIPMEAFKLSTLAQVARSDAVFLTPGWENSEGTQRELELCRKLGIPSFTNIERLRFWAEHRFEKRPSTMLEEKRKITVRLDRQGGECAD